MTSPAPQIHQPPELSVQSPLDQLVIYKGDTNYLIFWTGKKITRRNWTHLQIPSELIERINKIGSAQGQPKLLTFQDRQRHEKIDPNPYFQPLDHEIEGVVDDEYIEDTNAEDHEDCHANLADQGED